MQAFWKRVDVWMSQDRAVLLTVVATTGSAPRTPGARMAVGPQGGSIGSIGGGAAEDACLQAARKCLATGEARRISIDLRGDPHAPGMGVCGGTMTLLITPLNAGDEGPALRELQLAQAAGRPLGMRTRTDRRPFLELIPAGTTPASSNDAWDEMIECDPSLLIVGAGHIGRALAMGAAGLGFRVGVHDDRSEWLNPAAFPSHETLLPTLEGMVGWLFAGTRDAYVVLVTRGFATDLAALSALGTAVTGLRYLGILGSARRIAVLREQCVAHGLRDWPPDATHAPVGLNIGAESPEEIAISILAEMIEVRRLRRNA